MKNIDSKLLQKIEALVAGFPSAIAAFRGSNGPDLYFYQKVCVAHHDTSLRALLDGSDRFIELIYATLAAWNMNCRRAKMLPYAAFKASILDNKSQILQLESFRLDAIPMESTNSIKDLLWEIYEHMKLMHTASKLVSNAKILHFLLPNLVMPMDGKYTLQYFFENTDESPRRFLQIFLASHEIAQKVEFQPYFDTKWDQNAPKIIDNAVMGWMDMHHYNQPNPAVD